MNQHNNSTNQIPHDLAPIAAAVNELAHSERRSAPATLESRVFMTSRGGLTAGREIHGDEPLPIVLKRVSWLSRAKVAAILTVCAGGLAIWMAQLNHSAAVNQGNTIAGGSAPKTAADLAGLEADVELLLTIRTLADGFDEIDDLYLDAEELSSSLQNDWLKNVIDEGVM